MRGAIVRKYRSTITQTALVTFDQLVRIPGDGVVWNSVDQEYNFENKSQIVVAGLDDPGKILSTEFDIIYVQECTQIDENTWETLTTRLRWNHMPYQQLIGDCNPDSSRHWIKRRQAAGKLNLMESTHKDNPTLWDEEKEEWTPFGDDYISTLKNLSGTVRERLFEGKWVGAEGVVYTNWNPDIHIVDNFKIPPHWDRYLAIDFGYNNPFVCQWWAINHDGDMYMYRELYGVHMAVEDWAHLIAEHSKNEKIKFAICDHDLEDQATLRRHGAHTAEQCKQSSEKRSTKPTNGFLRTVGADKERASVNAGIEAVQMRLKLGPNGKPRMYFFRNALAIAPDAELVNQKKPVSTLEEFDEYIWDEVQSGRLGARTLEQPRKLFDHGMDAMRYFVRYIDARQSPGTKVNVFGQKTPFGYGNSHKTPEEIVNAELKDNYWKR